jgi:hypothetical protein
MKKLFLLLLVFANFPGLYAQTQYKHCLDDGMTRWSFLDYHIIDAGLVSTELFAYGDTLINGLIYKRIYHDIFNDFDAEESNENWKNHTPRLDLWTWENYYIRESEDASKLYLYNAQANEEYLISDIDLQEGDTFRAFNAIAEGIVDSVYFKNELKHVRLSFPDGYYTDFSEQPFTLIEGIGPNHWFIYPYQFQTHQYVNCFQNQTLFYKNTEAMFSYDLRLCPCGYFDRDAVAVKTIEKENDRILIQNSQVEILFSKKGNASVFLYDIYGNLLYTKQTVASLNLVIPTDAYSRGTYILRIIHQDKDWINKIIL